MLIEPITLNEIKGLCSILSTELEPRAVELQKEMPNKVDTAWTRTIKSLLHEIGLRKNYQSLYSNRDKELHEFMLDFVWWDKRPEYECAILACECELGNKRDSGRDPERVAEDFEKLLSFKAPLKLMIFDSYGVPEMVNRVVHLLDRYLATYKLHLNGEAYVLWDISKGLHFWKCDILRDGRDESLHFKEFDINI